MFGSIKSAGSIKSKVRTLMLASDKMMKQIAESAESYRQSLGAGDLPSEDGALAHFRVRFTGRGLRRLMGKHEDALWDAAGATVAERGHYRSALCEVAAEIATEMFLDGLGATEEARATVERETGVSWRVGFLRAFAGLCEDWEDRSLMALGVTIWNARHKAATNQAEAEEGTRRWIATLYASADSTKRATAARFAVFASTWAVHAFQKVATTHTYAAALMCSDASREALGDIHLPWRAFMICVPNGLLTHTADGVQIDYTRVLVTVRADDSADLILYAPDAPDTVNGRSLSHGDRTFASLLYEDPTLLVGSEGRRDLDGVEMRTLRLAKRLVVGVLLSMQHRDNFRVQKTRNFGASKRRDGEPEHRNVFVGRPIKVDCRPAVRDYLQGKGTKHGPASVQVLVTGHFKRQVIGVGRMGRKVIWIEPYWRGPEEAPILTRPKVLGSA